MNKGFWYGVFRPGWNRYYADRKLYKIAYLIRYVPVAAGLILLSVLYPSKADIVLAVAVVVLGLLDYFVFGMLSEKLLWNLIYKRFYGDEAAPAEYEAIKQYDKNPNPQNLESVKKIMSESKENNG